MDRSATFGQSFVLREFSFQSGSVTASELTNNAVHVWRRVLESHSEELEFYRGLLSSDEEERARRFRFASDRNEFVIARSTLRILVGKYLACTPESLRFSYTQHGRPSLWPEFNPEVLDFNVSHSGGIALLAFARRRRIGVDIEKVTRDFNTSEIAQRFFSVSERAALQELPEEKRHEAFFRCWTRKEAFIKALGEGLSHPLDQFDVALRPGAPALILATRPDAGEAKRWSLWNIEVVGDYAAALVVERI